MTSALWLIVVAQGMAAFLGTQPTFRSRVESVRLDVLVTQSGKGVSGLTAEDFEVRDNGSIQKVTFIGSDSMPLDIILALDMSSSLTPDRLDALRTASASLLNALAEGDRVALATFNHVVIRRQPLTRDHDLVRAALDAAAPSGATSLIDAMYAGISMADPGDRRTLLIVFSDGIDTASWLSAAAVVRAAQRSETVIYAVSTAAADRTQTLLRDVTAAAGGRVYEVLSKQLASTFVQILEEFRQRYLLSYTLSPAPSPGWHRIEVRVKKRGATVKTRSGYHVPPR